jgi:hypothetical protein
MSRTLLALAMVLGIASWGCSGGSGGGEEAPAGGGAAEEEPVQSESAAGRDLSAVDVCALVPAEAVAEAMGEKPAGPSSSYDPGFEGKGCRYKSGQRYAEVSLLPPDHFRFRRNMTPADRLQELGGLADGAYWEARSDRTDVYLLRAGDATIWIRFQDRGKATRAEDARKLGEAVLATLK